MNYKSSKLNLYDSTNFTQLFEIKNDLDKVSYTSTGQSEFNATSITFIKKDQNGNTVSQIADVVSQIIETKDGLAAEVSTRATADSALDSKISDEVKNRTDADSALDGKISDEVKNRTDADTALDEKINTEKQRIDAIMSGSTVDLDTFQEVVSYVNSLDSTQLNLITNLQSQVNALQAVVDSFVPVSGRG